MPELYISPEAPTTELAGMSIDSPEPSVPISDQPRGKIIVQEEAEAQQLLEQEISTNLLAEEKTQPFEMQTVDQSVMHKVGMPDGRVINASPLLNGSQLLMLDDIQNKGGNAEDYVGMVKQNTFLNARRPQTRNYGTRADGTPKGAGFLGELQRPNGEVSTEISIGVNIDGEEIEIPSLVPTLSQPEIDLLLSGMKPTAEIVEKATAHAEERIARGKSPFADPPRVGIGAAERIFFDASIIGAKNAANEFLAGLGGMLDRRGAELKGLKSDAFAIKETDSREVKLQKAMDLVWMGAAFGDPREGADFAMANINPDIGESASKMGKEYFDKETAIVEDRLKGLSTEEKAIAGGASFFTNIVGGLGFAATFRNPLALAELYALPAGGRTFEAAKAKGLSGTTAGIASDLSTGINFLAGIYGGTKIIEAVGRETISKVILGSSIVGAVQGGGQTVGEVGVYNAFGITEDTFPQAVGKIFKGILLGAFGGGMVGGVHQSFVKIKENLVKDGSSPSLIDHIMKVIEENPDVLGEGLGEGLIEVRNAENHPINQAVGEEGRKQAQELKDGVENGTIDATLYRDARYLGSNHKEAVKQSTIASATPEERLRFLDDRAKTELLTIGRLAERDNLRAQLNDTGIDKGESIASDDLTDIVPIEPTPNPLYNNKREVTQNEKDQEIIEYQAVGNKGKISFWLPRKVSFSTDQATLHSEFDSGNIQQVPEKAGNCYREAAEFTKKEPNSTMTIGVMTAPDGTRRYHSVNTINDNLGRPVLIYDATFGRAFTPRLYEEVTEFTPLIDYTASEIKDSGQRVGFYPDPVNSGLPPAEQVAYVKKKSTASEEKTPEQQPPAPDENKPLAPLPDENGVPGIINDANLPAASSKKGFLSQTNEMLNRAFVPISTRIGRMSEKVKYQLRKFEFKSSKNRGQDLRGATPLIQGYRYMPPDDQRAFKKAALNADGETLNALAKKHGFEEALAQNRQVFDNIRLRAKDAGVDLGYIENYFSRYISDAQGFMQAAKGKPEYQNVLKKLTEARQKLKRPLTVEEEAQITDAFYQESRKGEFKKRTDLEITDDMLDYYADPDEAALRYLHSVNNEIEMRNLLGNNAPDLSDRVSFYTAKQVADGKILPSQELELHSMLMSRFDQGKMNGVIGAFRDLTYIDSMGGFPNALSQLGDLGFAAYQAGVVGAAKNTALSFMGKSKLTKKTMGLDDISAEFSEPTKTAAAVKGVFKLTGITAFDNLGANTNLNSAVDSYRAAARAKKPRKEFTRTMENMFGDEAPQVIEDLKNGAMTENIELLAFNRLLDFSPRAPSEMPQGYLDMKNGKIFYTLKSFMIRQIDAYRNETVGVMRRDPIQGTKNLVRLTASLALVGAGVDMLKNIIFDRPLDDIDDALVWNTLKIFNVNRYDTQSLQGGDKPSEVIINKIVPPFKIFNNAAQDLGDIAQGKDIEAQDRRVIQDIPLIGSTLYNRTGRGSEEGKERREERQKEERAESREEDDDEDDDENN